MIKSTMTRFAAWLSLVVSNFALAAGDSGTATVAEMEVSASQFGMLLGGAITLGVVIWLVIRTLNR